MNYRGSEAPLAMLCAGSVNAPENEVLLDSVNPAGRVGTVVHSICEHMVNHDGRLPLNWQETCRAHGLNAAQTKEVGSLIFAAKAFWDANKDAFGPRVDTEHELLFSNLSTHLDIFSRGDRPGVAFDLDWKTTRLDIDYTAQLLFGAWLIVLNYPETERVTTAIVFLRDRTDNIKEWSKEQILDFGGRYTREVINWDGRTFRPGGHCAYCKRFVGCPARGAMVQKTIQELSPDAIGSGSVVDFYKRLQAVEALTKKAREQVRAAVEQAGGELPSLKLVPSSLDTIVAKRAWPVLISIMEADDFADAVAINKTDLLDAYAAIVPKGQKGKAKKKLIEELKEAGAVETTEFKTLRVVQSKEGKELDIGTETE